MGTSYRPENPFAPKRTYRPGNPFAEAPQAPDLTARSDAMAVDTGRHDREAGQAIEANLREAREEQADTAPLTEAELDAARQRNVSPLTAGVAEGVRHIGGGVAQVLARGTPLERPIRRLRERSAAADEQVAAKDLPSRIGRGGARILTETAPLIAAGTPSNLLAAAPTLIERLLGRAATDAASFGAFEAASEPLEPRPSLEHAADRASAGARFGAGMGAGVPVLEEALLRGVPAATEAIQRGRYGTEAPSRVEVPRMLQAGAPSEPVPVAARTEPPLAREHGVTPKPATSEDVEAMIGRPLAEVGGAHPTVVSGVAGAGAGAGIGFTQGDDENSRIRNAVLAAVAGGLAGAAAGRRVAVGRRLIESGAPQGRMAEAIVEERPQFPGRVMEPRSGGTPAEDIDPTLHVRLSKFALDPTAEVRLREEVQRVASTFGLDPKRVVTWDETREIAQTLGLSPGDLVRQPGRLSGPQMLAARNIVADNVRALSTISPQLEQASARALNPTLEASAREAAATEAERLQVHQTALQSQNDALLSRFIRDRSQTGRDLNNLKILAHTSLDPVTWLAKARQLRGMPLLAEQEAEIGRLVHEATTNPEARVALVQYVSRLRTAPLVEKALTVWKAGLLTSPTTHVANQVGNASMAALEQAKDVPAAFFDRIMSFATGTRTKGGASAETVAASLRGARQGVKEAMGVMRGQGFANALQRYDLTREVTFDNPILQAYTQTVFRALSAGDRIWKGAAFRRSLTEQAQLLARSSGRPVAEIIAHPPDEIVVRALGDADVATFNDRTALSKVLTSVQQSGGAVTQVLVPFARTPGNIGTRMVEYGGGGLAHGVLMIARRGGLKGLDAATQRAVAETMGRGSVGPLAIGMGYLLASQGKMTGAPSTQRGERDTQALVGRQPYAIRIGGQWRDIRRLSPLGNLMGFGATLYELHHNPDTDNLVATGLAAAGKQVVEQSSLAGVQGAIQALTDPQAGATYAERLASSVVPGVVRRVAQATDPTVRQPRTLPETMEASLPGLSRSVAPKVNQLGDIVQRDSGEPAILAALLDPTNPRVDRSQQDQVRRALAETGAAIPNLGRKPDESSDAYVRRAQQTGHAVFQRLLRTVASGRYQSASVEERKDLLEEAASGERAAMTRRYRANNPFAVARP